MVDIYKQWYIDNIYIYIYYIYIDIYHNMHIPTCIHIYILIIIIVIAEKSLQVHKGIEISYSTINK